MIIYGIFDKKAESFKEIIQAENDDMCKRVLYRVLSGSQQSDYVMFPDDFAVYRLAYFNNRNGSVYSKDLKCIAFELISLFKKPAEPDGSVMDDPSGSEAPTSEASVSKE